MCLFIIFLGFTSTRLGLGNVLSKDITVVLVCLSPLTLLRNKENSYNTGTMDIFSIYRLKKSHMYMEERTKPAANECKKTRVKLASKFPCRTHHGMSCAFDTAWHKRGFDSLTCKKQKLFCVYQVMSKKSFIVQDI